MEFEYINRVQSTIEDIDRAEKSVFWKDCIAQINGRIAEIAQALCTPDKTRTIEETRQLQGAREELLNVRDLPDVLRAEREEQEKEDGNPSE